MSGGIQQGYTGSVSNAVDAVNALLEVDLDSELPAAAGGGTHTQRSSTLGRPVRFALTMTPFTG